MLECKCELNICCYRTRADCCGSNRSSLCAAVWLQCFYYLQKHYVMLFDILLDARGLFSVFWLVIQQRLKVSSCSLRLSLCASIFYGFEDEILGKVGEVVFRGLLQLPCHLKCMASISDSLYIKM